LPITQLKKEVENKLTTQNSFYGYDSEIEWILGKVDLEDSYKNSDQMKQKINIEEAYQADIKALRKWLDFLEMSWGSIGSTVWEDSLPNPNEGEIP